MRGKCPMMKKFIYSIVGIVLSSGFAMADDVKIGILMGFTGPIESLAPDIAAGGELAIREVSESGMLLGGHSVVAVRGDSTCVDAAAATAAAERLVTSDGVAAINGANCSGVTTAVLNNVVLPNGIVMISPSATTPALSTAEDNGLFFRTAPSDARQGQVMANILGSRGITSVAVTYTNNDYGKGLADSFQSAYSGAGGEITTSVSHEDGKADYSAEVATLASAGGEVLVVIGYLDQGGKGIIQASLDNGAFDAFMLPDGMVGESLTDAFGTDINGSFGTRPGTDSPGATMLSDLAGSSFKASGPYAGESYDASALILLAMQSAGSTNSADFKSHVEKVANAPGEKIYPGELAKALKILADGGEIDYVGASAVELIGPGESSGSYFEVEVKKGTFEKVANH